MIVSDASSGQVRYCFNLNSFEVALFDGSDMYTARGNKSGHLMAIYLVDIIYR